MPEVKTSKARSRAAGTTTERRIGSSVCITEGLLEGGQRALPHAVQVGAQDLQAGRVDLVEAPRAGLAVDHQPDVLEHLQVLGDGGAADRQVGGELADGAGAV